MSRLHICNTFFEKELEKESARPLVHWFRSHPVVLQLQFLPLLYAGPEDKILVSDLPPHPDPRLCSIDHPPTGYLLEHWGPSLAVVQWAKEHNIPYSLPPWELVRKINSKVFSFQESPKLPGACLLETEEEVKAWLQTTPGPKVLKTPFGTAGNGHRHISPGDSGSVYKALSQPCIKWSEHVKPLYMGPIIGEPWVERIVDFSTQWKEQKLVGVTLFENEPNGTYKGTYKGEVEKWALDEHLAIAQPLVEKIGAMGYGGHIGIDAFIYWWKGEKRIHPVVEINGRKTMSWVAMQRTEKRVDYKLSKNGLLPPSLKGKDFVRNIICT